MNKEDNSKEFSLLQSLKLAREIFPSVGIFVVLSYIVGFFIVNLHLANYNYVTFELVRGRYLGAGSCFFYLILILLIPQSVARIVLREMPLKHKKSVLIRFLVLPTAGIVVIAITWSILFITGFIKSDWTYTIWLLAFFLMVNALLHLLVTALKNRFLNRWSTVQHPFKFVFRPLYIMLALNYLVLLMVAFALYIFPHIPGAVGGGRPITAQIVIRSELFTMLFSKEPEHSKNGFTSIRNVDLIFDDNNYYLVQIAGKPSPRIVQVPKSEINLLILSKPNIGEASSKKDSPTTPAKNQ